MALQIVQNAFYPHTVALVYLAEFVIVLSNAFGRVNSLVKVFVYEEVIVWAA